MLFVYSSVEELNQSPRRGKSRDYHDFIVTEGGDGLVRMVGQTEVNLRFQISPA